MHRSPSPALALLIRSNEVVQHLSPYRIAFRRARRSKTAKTRRGRGADRKKTTTPDMNAAARHGPLLHANSEPIDDRHRLGWPRGAGDITRGMAGQRTRGRGIGRGQQHVRTAPRHGPGPLFSIERGRNERQRRIPRTTRTPVPSPVGVNSAGIWPPLALSARPPGPAPSFRFHPHLSLPDWPRHAV
jgi:hypothetical protein